jgi:hypothetical protein
MASTSWTRARASCASCRACSYRSRALLGVAEGLQGSGFEGLDADLVGELEGLAGQLERLVVAAGVSVDAGEVAKRV